MANISDISRNSMMLRGPIAKKGYERWWHFLTAENAETGKKKALIDKIYAEGVGCEYGEYDKQ